MRDDKGHFTPLTGRKHPLIERMERRVGEPPEPLTPEEFSTDVEYEGETLPGKPVDTDAPERVG